MNDAKPVTVAQLIVMLSAMPQDVGVFIKDADTGWSLGEISLELDEDGDVLIDGGSYDQWGGVTDSPPPIYIGLGHDYTTMDDALRALADPPKEPS